MMIDAPRPADAEQLGPLLLRVWLETYPHPAAGIDEEWIREQRGSAATAEGIDQWREFIAAAQREPEVSYCRVVRRGTGLVGVICGLRGELVTLGPMYLLEEVQGSGLGGRLMAEFLAWAGSDPMALWVTEYNERAVRFYRRYGFEPTGERELWRGRLPNLRMVRDGGSGGGDGAGVIGGVAGSGDAFRSQ
ncbi:N-acetyltransferase [Kitasatospora sp. MMS16-BH015]|uniref:GNAT family N-acetyltransferase n=1 Tax=Kitasatospora sp. MMS16-BH015 TaxID=2018025 RepID=UPI000CA29A11|nr:GNAT family N-acetyltransferase [Kitasatospora sp. MMS16-BH015]AUG75821.1 N-acetyltransferase [Kitasatospora sp. MMS16-BH015]